ncbi:NagC family transcriptional regulator [Sulfolobales archaeon HS-7]|nr:NagC family transcriptional regulator [Sulfolobales archaeon HS-7]
MFKANDLKKLKKFGINVEEINAIRVIIETNDKVITIDSPTVTYVSGQGQNMYAVTGGKIEEREKKEEIEINEDDINFVMQQTGKNREECVTALRKANGDIAKAIEILSS